MGHGICKTYAFDGELVLQTFCCTILRCRQNPSMFHITLHQDAELVMSDFLKEHNVVGDICSYAVHFGHAIFYIDGDKEDAPASTLSNIPFTERMHVVNPRKDKLIFTCTVCNTQKNNPT